MSNASTRHANFSLKTTQTWVQHVITHPRGVDAAMNSQESRALLGVGPDDLEDVILPSKNLTARERIGIYSNMIVWRLIDCLIGDFPVVKKAVGDGRFEELIRAYLAFHPSKHYSLNYLGAKFSNFLADESGEKNRHVLSEIAQLEWALQEVFDAARAEPLSRVQLMTVPQDQWPEMRIRFVPAFRLLAFTYPVNTYLQAVRDERKVRIPRPRASWVFVYRKNFKVHRESLDLPRYTILSSLQQGASVGDALEKVASLPGVKWELLAQRIGPWFNEWAGMGLFAGVELPGDATP